jgi:peptidoglycan/LPS O-acetylase OafA/YrhL
MRSVPDLTLGIYLINWPAAQLLLLAFPDVGPWELIALSLPVTLGLALVTHVLISGRLFKWVSQLEKSVSSPPALSQA